jgi:TonB family protein
VILGLVVATIAVAYAAAGGRLPVDGVLGRFGAGQRLPALRSKELPFLYPAHLWRDGVEGEVLLRIHITEAGAVDSVELERSSGNVELDEVAVSGARKLSYHPALEGEEPVAVWAVLPVRFQRQSTTATMESRE